MGVIVAGVMTAVHSRRFCFRRRVLGLEPVGGGERGGLVRLHRGQAGKFVGSGAFRVVAAAPGRAESHALELSRNSPSILRLKA